MQSTRAARFIILLTCCLTLAVAGFAQSAQNRVIVIHETHHDVSLPARELAAHATPLSPTQMRILYPGARPQPFSTVAQRPDAVAQHEVLPDVGTTNLLNFDGNGPSGFVPPDTNGSAGSTQFVQTVNVNYSVYDKTTGSKVLGPVAVSSLWSGFGGMCQTGPNYSDPVVIWDKLAQRWLITIITFNNSFNQDSVCVAVSTSTDATGSYNRYAFSFSPNISDYPKFGVWPDAYYMNVNIFSNGGTVFAGAQPCAMDRNKMLSGSTATIVCFPARPLDYSFLPSDLDGATPPPTGAPNTFVELFSSTTLNAYKFHVDFVNTNNSTFTGPTAINIANWTQICATTRACIPQPSPGELVDSIGNRIMFRLGYRNFGDHETLTATHTVMPGTGSTATAAVRWYELRATPVGGNYTVFQQGTFQNAKISLWMPSIGMDKVGDIAVGMSASSSTVKPSVVYTGRIPTDPKNKLESPFVVVHGTGVQTVGGGNRWGDYSSMGIDPTDDCTFWYTQEYYKTNSGGGWNTRINSFKFPGCH